MKKSNKASANEQERLTKAVDSKVTDNQNINSGHNVKKVSLGPNTKR